MRIARFLLLATAVFTVAPQVQAATIQLTQSGWSEGGPLVIRFTGEDLNTDGAIDDFELTAFSASFILPGGGTAGLSLADVDTGGFSFRSVASFFIKADSPDYSLYDIDQPGGALALFSDSFGSFVSFSGDPLQQTTPTPEPSTGILAALAGTGTLFAARLRRNRR
ncbi:MAG: hypothetical protein H7Y20_11405 [Bryobacteraceae bacterium]|nr:hypothetical protein [Bryobacteraceae bacterium]